MRLQLRMSRSALIVNAMPERRFSPPETDRLSALTAEPPPLGPAAAAGRVQALRAEQAVRHLSRARAAIDLPALTVPLLVRTPGTPGRWRPSPPPWSRSCDGGPLRAAAREAHRCLRGLRRRRQDHSGRRHRARPGARGRQGPRLHHRSGAAPRQRARAGVARQRRDARAGGGAARGRARGEGRALRHDARREAHLGRPRGAARPRRRAARADLPQPPLPAALERPGRIAGVHGDGEAVRARHRARLRSHRARHASHRPRPRLPGRARSRARLPRQRDRTHAARARHVGR